MQASPTSRLVSATMSAPRPSRRTTLLCFILVAESQGPSLAFAPPHRAHVSRASPPSRTSLSARPRRPSSSNWEDDTQSSRNNADVTDYKPPWRDHGGGGTNNNNNNLGKEEFQSKTTDDFKRPHGSMPAGNEPRGAPPPRASTFRHAFQMSSTDDFKRPHDMPARMEAQQPPPRGNVFKAPFQTSSTDDFRRSSDVASGVGSPQQPIYNKPPRSESKQWQNTVGQDVYESTQLPPPPQTQDVSPQPPRTQDVSPRPPPPQSASQNAQAVQTPKDFFDAQIIDDQAVNNVEQPTVTPPPGSQPPEATPSMSQQISAGQHMEQWDKKLETAQAKSKSTLLRAIDWPLTTDPLGDSSEFPISLTRSGVVVLSTLATWYLHLFNGCSPVLASSAVALLVSTFVDRRLGQAALCGSFAGMSGGHLVPNLAMASVLGALTSASYEMLINVNNLCSGIGGRLGATAFLATSLMAKYSGVKMVGRKLRRGLWKSGAGPSTILVTMVLFHTLGAVATIFLRESSDDAAAADPVRASSIVGLLGSLFLKDPMAMLALYGGSFVGMSLPSRIMHGIASGNAKVGQSQTAASLFASFAGAGAIAGAIHAISIHYGYWNGGWGGKAGLCAFAGCWVYRGLANVAQFLNQKS